MAPGYAYGWQNRACTSDSCVPFAQKHEHGCIRQSARTQFNQSMPRNGRCNISQRAVTGSSATARDRKSDRTAARSAGGRKGGAATRTRELLDSVRKKEDPAWMDTVRTPAANEKKMDGLFGRQGRV